MSTLGIDIGGSSIKAAILDEAGRVVWEHQSARYERPSRAELLGAVRELMRGAPSAADGVGRVGLCVPGLHNREGTAVEKSVNVPGLVGLPFAEIVGAARRGGTPGLAVVTSDAHAAAVDVWQTEGLSGRVLCLSLGTGVGACVLDEGKALHVSGGSPGHVGQVDVSWGDNAPVGPDGGRGSLEAYIGLPALRREYGREAERALESMDPGVPPLIALARAIRICHAIYRPQHVRLLGGVGIRLGHVVAALRERVARELTSVALEGWTLGAGTTDYHAARGVARMAGSD